MVGVIDEDSIQDDDVAQEAVDEDIFQDSMFDEEDVDVEKLQSAEATLEAFLGQPLRVQQLPGGVVDALTKPRGEPDDEPKLPPDSVVQATAPQPRPALTAPMRLAEARIKDKRLREMAEVYHMATLLGFANDKSVAKRLWESRTWNKPDWATIALVILRDGGLCRLCGDRVGRQPIVECIVPPADGGGFSEPMCLTLCRHCAECWDRYKNFFHEQDFMLGFKRLQRFVLGRRLKNHHGVKGLNREQVLEYRKCKKQVQALSKAHKLVKTPKGAKMLERFLAGGDK